MPELGVCRVCAVEFRYSSKTRPVTCGDLFCYATAKWTPEEWEGAANMADVRRTCGLPLSDLDVEALRRFPTPKGSFRHAGATVAVAAPVGAVATRSAPTRDHVGPARRDWGDE